MTPNGMSTPDEFLKQIQEIQKELYNAREKAWQSAKETLTRVMEKSELPKTLQTPISVMLQSVWMNGYTMGTQNLSKYMMREMGLGHIIDFTDSLQTLQKNLDKIKPENN